ncbi:MAG: helix-turn-helix transcriptional regulator [Eubacterium sp.]
MAKKDFASEWENKQALGRMIIQCRCGMSQRQLAKAIGIPPSNLTYIENGVNVPSPDVYAKIIKVLNPTIEEHREMDKLYSTIRNVPPPDVCEVILNHDGLGNTLKLLTGKTLTKQDIKRIETLFCSF